MLSKEKGSVSVYTGCRTMRRNPLEKELESDVLPFVVEKQAQATFSGSRTAVAILPSSSNIDLGGTDNSVIFWKG